MRLVIQRVSEARVSVANRVIAAIDRGLCVFIGIRNGDGQSQADHLAARLLRLRVFDDGQGKMNRSALDCGAGILVVSQFTLYGDLRKGNRPSFTDAARPDEARRLYEHFIERLRASELKVAAGQFQARMEVALKNDGPVTLIVEA